MLTFTFCGSENILNVTVRWREIAGVDIMQNRAKNALRGRKNAQGKTTPPPPNNFIFSFCLKIGYIAPFH